MEILVKASMGVAIFLVLMLLGSILEGLLIPHRPEKLSLAWNAIAILFSAGLAYVSVKGNRWLTIGIVLAIAFLVLTVQLGFPTYAKTLPNREEISTKYLKKHGTIGGPVLLIWHGAFGPPEPAPTNSVPTGSTSASSATTAEALELMYEGKTPCSTIIDYRFKIIWGDHPLRIIYPGDQIVDREGQGEDFHAPSSMRSGETKFVSLDPLLPRFRVQVYKVVTIQK
ncbi:MAG: hypothetical protein NTZ87_03245 [Candidatus Nomurabacteria bacterium]|nr:hypothetical protein [Candidatus Nomurabacteria bacterium]